MCPLAFVYPTVVWSAQQKQSVLQHSSVHACETKQGKNVWSMAQNGDKKEIELWVEMAKMSA